MRLDVERLEREMLNNCLNVNGLAAKAGVSRSTVDRVLNRRGTSCNRASAGRLAKALGLQPQEILKA